MENDPAVSVLSGTMIMLNWQQLMKG